MSKHTAIYLIVFALLFECFSRFDDWLQWRAPMFGNFEMQGILEHFDAKFKKFSTDADGFRLTPFTDPRAPRVMMLGASEMFGLYESAGAELPAALETLAQQRALKVDVVNASCFGQNVIRMRDFLVKSTSARSTESKLAAVVVYANAHFYLDVKVPRGANPDLAASDIAARVDARASAFKLRSVEKLKQTLKSFLPDQLQSKVREMDIARMRQAQPADWVWQSAPADRLARFEQDVNALVLAASNVADRVVLVTHANAFQVPTEFDASIWLNTLQRFYPRASKETLITFDKEANQILRRQQRKPGVEVIELAGKIPGDPDYFADFGHFTDAGAALAAQQIAKHLWP